MLSETFDPYKHTYVRTMIVKNSKWLKFPVLSYVHTYVVPYFRVSCHGKNL